jgi:hypothetical protein
VWLSPSSAPRLAQHVRAHALARSDRTVLEAGNDLLVRPA